MSRTNLAERQARLEQQRAKLQREESRVREAERKARTRRLIEAGGLIDKAGLLDALDPNALYGALLSIKEGLGDADAVKAWTAEGGRAFAREARARDEGREPLVIALAGAQPASVAARLRALGFRFSKVMQHWEGLARPDEAQTLADELGGALRRVNPLPEATAAPAVAAE